MIKLDTLPKGSLTFKSFAILDQIFMKVFGYFSKVKLSKTIDFFEMDYETNSISLDINGRQRLYALKLETGSNEIVKIENFAQFTNQIRHDKDRQTEVMISFVKQDNIEAIYVFTLDRGIAEEIALSFSIQLLPPPEILTALYHIFLLDVYLENDKRSINKYNDVEYSEDIDLLYKKFPSLIAIASDSILNKYTPYQITGFKGSSHFSVLELFRTEWNGVCNLFFDFSTHKTKGQIELMQRAAKFGDSITNKALNKLRKDPENKEAIEEIENKCFVANGMFFLKEQKTASAFQSIMGISAEERFLLVDKLLPKTLLMARDIDFDIIVHQDIISKFFQTSLCRDCLAKPLKDEAENLKHGVGSNVFLKVDFYGRDINNNFFNCMLKGNSSPHMLIFGTTGAGKSVAALKMVSQIIGYDFETGKANDLNENRKIRYINVGYTGGRIFDSIRKNNNTPEKKMIEIVPPDVSKLRFSLFDFDDISRPTEEEWLMFRDFINLMLTVSGGPDKALDPLEEAALKTSLYRMLQLKGEADEGGYPLLTLREIRNNQTYGKSYEEIIDEILKIKDENGNPKYNERTRADELTPEYNRFARPILNDLVNAIKGQTKNIQLSEEEQTRFGSLGEKLNFISKNPVFAYFNNVVVRENYPAYYAEFDKIKGDSKNFVSVGWLLFQNWFKYDKLQAMKQQNADLPRPDTFYFIEEAHNFFNIPVFSKLLDTFAREVRKYGIHLILITQSTGDVDQEFAELFSTRCFLFKMKDKDVAYAGVKSVNGNKDLSGPAQQIYDAIKENPDGNRTIFMLNSSGASAFTLPAYKKYGNMFMPYEIQTA